MGVVLTPLEEEDSAVLEDTPDDVAVIDAGASAHGIVVAEWNTLGEPSTMDVQVVETMATDEASTLLVPSIPQRVDPASAVFLTITEGSPSLTQAVMQPLLPTETDLQATTSKSSSPEE